MDLVLGDLRKGFNMHVEGRHLGPHGLFSKNIVSEVSVYKVPYKAPEGSNFDDNDYLVGMVGAGVTIRLDDKENLAWWLSIRLSKEELQEMLKEIEK